MNKNQVLYDVNSQSIIILNDKKKEEFIQNVLEELESSIINYVSQKLSEQEMHLFNFPESNFLENDKKLFYLTIQKLIDDIKKNKNYQYVKGNPILFKDSDKGQLELNYQEICGVVNYIISIFDNLPKKKNYVYLYDFAFNGVIPNMKINLKEVSLSDLTRKAFNIKKLDICLSNKNYKNIKDIKKKSLIDIKVIQLFCIFFKAFFKNALSLKIDLNIYEINEYFNNQINIYQINPEKIQEIGNYFKKIILGNAIIVKKLAKIETLTKVSFKIYDSYQIELHYLLSKYFSKNINENNENTTNFSINNNSKNFRELKLSPVYQNKFIYFQHILPKIGTEFYQFDINFNSLDPLLFSYTNIILIRYACLADIYIKFFDFDNINFRKILINSYYYNSYRGAKKNPLATKYSPEKTNAKFDINYKIYFNQIDNISDNENKELLLLRDETILNELFPYFNYNLNTLLIIIENKIKDQSNQLSSLYLNFKSGNSGYTNLNIYDNYNSAIICFLYNFINILEKNKNICNLVSLDLLLDDYSGEKEFLIKSLQNKFALRKSNIFDLKEIRITHLYFDIPNISLILPFENFPKEKLTELIIDNLSYNDLNNIVNSLKNDKNLFNKLISFEIGLSLMIEDFRSKIFILLKDCISPNISIFKLNIRSNTSYEDIIDILTSIKKNKNKKAIFFLKLSNSNISPTVNTPYFKKMIEEFKKSCKKELIKRNIISDFICVDYKKISLSIKMLNNENTNYFLKFIYCFNKKKNNNNKDGDKNKKIFENIFYFMGKFRKKNKEIRIEFN